MVLIIHFIYINIKNRKKKNDYIYNHGVVKDQGRQVTEEIVLREAWWMYAILIICVAGLVKLYIDYKK
jgi:hypothetical protein